ncbi:glycerate kinase type-2 family protein [Acidihalobacter prosperus]|uniref:D-glycerate 2-kinase n=1 Tax=Acidihalobacter prosperus TaxID=160660 RepID=A0A1A6C6W1_9GAMM|nr:DUF4147 domain-containing protein [Acidihalobacter prosperus]OBS10297.1 D-glycerate 2-kinase [Acidihalobacter prosperus]
MADPTPRDTLLALYRAALTRVDGRHAVRRWLEDHPLEGGCWRVVALGKAASAMALGAHEALGDRLSAGLLVTKTGHLDAAAEADPRFGIYVAEHPWPGAGSLRAGRALIEFIDAGAADVPLLFLVSGGASSLVEVPVAGVDLGFLRQANDWLLASGLAIDEINRVRQRLSQIKGGGLRRRLNGRPALALVISDVPGDDARAIGSGPLAEPLPGSPPPVPEWLSTRLATPPVLTDLPPVPHHLIASLDQALAAVEAEAGRMGLRVERMPAPLSGDAGVAGRRVAEALCQGPVGVSLWGGETTVTLPDRPGRGGRNQHLALAAAEVLAGRRDCWLLSAGTDGTDGPTDDAGALVSGGTLTRGRRQGLDPETALNKADAGSFLEASGDLIHTGPTGTNVMDLVIGLRTER